MGAHSFSAKASWDDSWDDLDAQLRLGAADVRQRSPAPEPERSTELSKSGQRAKPLAYHAGEVIAGKYELIRSLSQGGMGSVWVARNRDLDVHVAMKLIRPDLDASFVSERFVAEARLAARIEHPAIVSVFDLGHTERGDPYIVMELLRGEDLRSILDEQRRLSATHAVQLLLPIAEALATAHAKGIVHRDLKPENVFLAKLDDRLQPKVVDFGIAKSEFITQRRITRAGAVVGSPDYMSPEQARGQEDVDPRADVWAFAVVLYECVTGSPPFAESSYEALLRDILEKAVTPITELGVPDGELWAILERALAKDRDERYQTMKEFGRALARWLRSRWVDEDVCGHSLRATWLRETELGRGSASGVEPVLLEPKRSRLEQQLPTLQLDDLASSGSLKLSPLPARVSKRRVAFFRARMHYALSASLAVALAWFAKPVVLGASQESPALRRLPPLTATQLTAELHRPSEPSKGQTEAAPNQPAPNDVAQRARQNRARMRSAPFREILVVPARSAGGLPSERAAANGAEPSSAKSWPAARRALSKPVPLTPQSKRKQVAQIDPVFGF